MTPTESPRGGGRSSAPPPDEIHVVFVDDERDVLDLEMEYLQRACERPLTVTATTDPGTALDAVASGTVDCVVSDYEMPELDGLALLRRVEELDPRLPFILFTARGSEEVASTAIRSGATDYLQKAFTANRFELLANRIHNAVEHYRMRRNHEEQMALLESVANNIAESVFVAGTDAGLLYVSDVIQDLYGIPKEKLEADPLSFRQHVHPDDLPRVDEWIARMEFDHEADDWNDEYRAEYRFDHPETGWRWIRATVSPVGDDEVTSTRLVGTAADITEEKTAVLALERSEETFRSIAELSTDVVYRIDADGVITYVSPAARDVLGYEPATMEGERVLDFIAPDDRDDAIANFGDGLDGAEQSEEVFDLQHADGHAVAIEVNQSPIRERGAVVGVQGVARDITDRRARERELEQYERLVQTVPDGVFVLDEAGRILVANERAAELAGNDPRKFDLPTPPVQDLGVGGVASDEAIARYTAAVEDLLASGADRTMYRLPVAVDGEERVLEFHIGLRPTDGGFRGTIGVVRDITERVQYERELERQNERLEQFANTVSHDLRNPLGVAMGRLDLVRAERDSPHLEVVAKHHERINSLIDDILRLARDGQSVENPEPVSLEAVVREAWQSVETAAATLHLDGEFGTVLADESRLRQLLENLFRNAVEHGGAAASVTVGSLPDGGGFFVGDDGPGIPEESRETVFEQGFSTAGSTGFGLAIVKDIVRAHGWSIAVREAPDGGARFEIASGRSASDPTPHREPAS